MATTIYWHDYEAFGADPRRDRASQFAGLRTDEQLNVIGDPLVIYCRPSPDMLPHPEACRLTGITPQLAREQGERESVFMAAIHEEMSRPGTCSAGYNSIRFDDELTRQLLYRNLLDPYEREWKNGNSRWDIIDMLRLCHALRPEGIEWPLREDGAPSFRLEALTAANGIGHEEAHDALSDVKATIAMAALVRRVQPKLYEYVFNLRRKRAVQAQIDTVGRKPFLHVSGMYGAENGAIAPVMPLAPHPVDANGIIVCDLREDPAQWMDLDADTLRQRLFTRREDRPEGQTPVPLKVLHINRCPVIAPVNALEEPQARRFGIDMKTCRRHWDTLLARDDLLAILSGVYAPRESGEGGRPVSTDPDFMLYAGGFFSAADKSQMQTIRQLPPESLADRHFDFQDPRLPEMLFRYRARNFPDTLTEQEQTQWRAFCAGRLQRGEDEEGACPPLAAFDEIMGNLEKETLSDSPEHRIHRALSDWRTEVCQFAGLTGKQ
ncbi:MAG: exodeoxyribonuclease I [Pseudohongiellaceae bacterium]